MAAPTRAGGISAVVVVVETLLIYSQPMTVPPSRSGCGGNADELFMPSSCCMAWYDAGGAIPPSASAVYVAASSPSAGPLGPPVAIQVCGGDSGVVVEEGAVAARPVLFAFPFFPRGVSSRCARHTGRPPPGPRAGPQ